MLQLKFSLKCWSNIFDWGRGALATPLPKTSKNVPWQKIRPVMSVLLSHARIMPVMEKNWLLSAF